jgi:Bromodomain
MSDTKSPSGQENGASSAAAPGAVGGGLDMGDVYSELSTSGKEAMRRMMRIVDSFLARPDSGPFREPVDWRGLELYDYVEVIKSPMDLGTVKRKLERGQYANAAACTYDIRLVWKNCSTSERVMFVLKLDCDTFGEMLLCSIFIFAKHVCLLLKL